MGYARYFTGPQRRIGFFFLRGGWVSGRAGGKGGGSSLHVFTPGSVSVDTSAATGVGAAASGGMTNDEGPSLHVFTVASISGSTAEKSEELAVSGSLDSGSLGRDS